MIKSAYMSIIIKKNEITEFDFEGNSQLILNE